MTIYIVNPRLIVSTAGERPIGGYPAGTIMFDQLNNLWLKWVGGIVWIPLSNPSLIQGKYGGYTCSHNTLADGYGLLSGLTGYGSLLANTDLNGYTHIWSTGTTAGSYAGVAVHKNVTNGLVMRNFSPHLITKMFIYPKSGTDSRGYIGFPGISTLLPQSDTPIATTEAGFLIGWRSTDSNFQLFINNAGGSNARVVDTLVALPSSLSIYYFDIEMSTTNIKWAIYNSTLSSVLGSGTETVQIPSVSQDLYLQAITQNTTTTSKNIGFFGMDIWSKV